MESKIGGNKKRFAKAFFVVIAVVSIFMVSQISNAVEPCRLYDLDSDFDEGILVGVEHDTVHNQLQLTQEPLILPFIWVPNQNGTVSKVNTETGDELGRYRVAPHSDCYPSRTTVDLQGNCWVGNRQAGTVVKIGLYEAGPCIDRNGDGVIQTSQDLNSDGDITGAEILPWGQDECVLYEVVLIPGKEGTYVPGTYAGGYDYNYWGPSPRGLAVDASNNFWAGTWSSQKYYYIEGSTGSILKTVDVSPWGHHAYGAVIDGNGILWSSGQAGSHVLRVDPSTDPPTISKLPMGHFTYGIGLDYLGHLFVSGWTSYTLSRVDVSTGTKDWTKWGPYTARGVACTSDNDVWIASTDLDRVYRFDNNGNYKTNIWVGNGPTGVAVDAAGKVWVCNLNDESIRRIDPATNSVDLTKYLIGSGGHYSYSDMTGIVSRTITTKLGTWTVDRDSGAADMPWGEIYWNSDEPAGTSVAVRVRSSNDGSSWSSWETATNAGALTATPDGRYLQIETTLQIVTGDVSPILYDLEVCVGMIQVDIDIKPGGYPNCFNINGSGVIPVAILGSDTLDVTQIDISTLNFGGLDVRLKGNDSPQCSIEDVSGDFASPGGVPDGYPDLVCQFVDDPDVWSADDGTAKITGNLLPDYGGIPIEGTDEICLRP